MHRSTEEYFDILLSVLPDDSLSDLKKRVVMECARLDQANSAKTPSDLYAWRTLTLTQEEAVAQLVNSAMESGGTRSIGPRIVTTSHMWSVYTHLTGLEGKQEKTKDETYITYQEAVNAVRLHAKIHDISIKIPMGVLHRTYHSQVMTADPFRATMSIDPNLSSQTGELRDLYSTITDDDVLTLETLFKAELTHYRLDMTSVYDLVQHATKTSTAIEAAWRAGYIRKYFPLGDSWRRSSGMPLSAKVGAEMKAFVSTQRALGDVRAQLNRARESTVERCVLTSTIILFGQTTARTKVSLDQSSGFDVLTRLFERFRVSREVPVIRYFDGNSGSYKVARIALSSKNAVVAEYLSRRTREAITIGLATGASRVAKAPFLSFLLLIGQNQFATVVLRQDLSYKMSRNFSTSHTNGGGSFEDIASTHILVNKRIMQNVWRIVNETGHSSSVLMHDTLHGWDDMDRMIGSTVSIGTSFTITVPEGRVPGMTEVREVVERMFPYFVPVRLPGEGNVLYLQYRRVDMFEHTDGLLQTMRLLREDPKDVMTEKIARAFGLSFEEALRRIDAQLKNGKVPYMQTLLRTGVSVTMSNSSRGIVCRVNGCSSAKQHRRIISLLNLAIDVTIKNDSSKFLSWVDANEKHDNVNVGVMTGTDPTPRPRRYLYDWEDEMDGDEGVDEDNREDVAVDEQDDGRGGDDIEALLAAELGTYDDSSRKKSTSTLFGALTHESILRDVQRSDPSLFMFTKSGYSTACGAVNGRQPIVVSKEELANLPRNSHTGAIGYGSTEGAASTNRFICPEVWCPRSRTSMTASNFEAAGRRCPIDKEEPIILDNKYFKGNKHYVGFLKPSKHPDGLCMPCCFRLPRQRYGLCTQAGHPGFYESDVPGTNSTKGKSVATKEDDPRYLRNQKAHLDEGRYGLLPAQMAELFGGPQKCGGRDDRSGQMNLQTNCFVRRGTARHAQIFMSSIIWALNNPQSQDIKSFVSLIEDHLTPDVFVSLNDGRMAQVLMREVIAAEDSSTHKEDESKFLNWIVSAQAEAYVSDSDLADVCSEAKALLTLSVKSRKSKAHRTDEHSMDFQREVLLYSAMMRYIAVLRDASIIKTHEHLLDLSSRRFEWLNPGHCNVLMFESEADDNGGEGSIFFTCPYNGGHLERHIRLSDPFVLILRQGSAYHPIVRVQLSRREGVEEKRTFFYDEDRFVHQTIYRILEGCRGSNASNDVSAIGILMTGLVAVGEKPRWQVLDYKLRVLGIMTASHVYICLPTWTTPLVGRVGVGLGTMYIANAMAMHLKTDQRRSVILDRLRVATGVDFTSPESKKSQGLLLQHLGVFIGRPTEDTRLGETGKVSSRKDCTARLVKLFREAIWEDASSASELMFLRHGFNPLPPAVKWHLMLKLVSKLIPIHASAPCRLDGFVEHVLFARDPLKQTMTALPITLGAISLTDNDLMSSSLEGLLGRGVHSFDGAVSGIEVSPMIPHGDVRSGSLVSMRKSLAATIGKLARGSVVASSGRMGSALPSRTSPSQEKQHSVVSGTRMIRCHAWRAMSLAKSLVDTEMYLPIGTPMMLMENDRVARKENDKKRVRPTDMAYSPDEHDVQVIATAFELSVRLIRRGKVLTIDPDSSTSKVLVLAWMANGEWYVVLSDDNRIMWQRGAANKIQSRVQGETR